MTRTTIDTIFGFLLATAGAALGFWAQARGGITWPVFLLCALLLTYGGHLISRTQVREIVDLIAQLIRAWQGTDRGQTDGV